MLVLLERLSPLAAETWLEKRFIGGFQLGVSCFGDFTGTALFNVSCFGDFTGKAFCNVSRFGDNWKGVLFCLALMSVSRFEAIGNGNGGDTLYN